MKYLKSYKLFESKDEYDIWDAIDCLNQKDIEEHYKEHQDITYEQLCEMNPEFIWKREYIDEDKFKENIIEDKIDKIIYKGIDFNDYELDEYEGFFEENYKEYVNDKTSEDELIEIIKKENLEREFLKFTYEDRYWNKDPEEIAKMNDKNYIDNTYDLTYMYVDDNKVVDDYIDNINWDLKVDYVAEDIPWSPQLQQKIFEYDPKNVLILFDVIEFEGEIGIAKDYEFQKAYIEHYKGETPEALKNLHDKFGLNDKIKEEFKSELYMIDAEKYNL